MEEEPIYENKRKQQKLLEKEEIIYKRENKYLGTCGKKTENRGKQEVE